MSWFSKQKQKEKTIFNDSKNHQSFEEDMEHLEELPRVSSISSGDDKDQDQDQDQDQRSFVKRSTKRVFNGISNGVYGTKSFISSVGHLVLGTGAVGYNYTSGFVKNVINHASDVINHASDVINHATNRVRYVTNRIRDHVRDVTIGTFNKTLQSGSFVYYNVIDRQKINDQKLLARSFELNLEVDKVHNLEQREKITRAIQFASYGLPLLYACFIFKGEFKNVSVRNSHNASNITSWLKFSYDLVPNSLNFQKHESQTEH
jgi:hypothetical protein